MCGAGNKSDIPGTRKKEGSKNHVKIIGSEYFSGPILL